MIFMPRVMGNFQFVLLVNYTGRKEPTRLLKMEAFCREQQVHTQYT